MAPRDRPRAPGSTPLTAEELVAVVRVHLDRVFDAVRRTGGQDGSAALEVVRASALATVDEVATRALGAEQAVGTWFRRALTLAGGRSGDGWHEVGDALAALSDDARLAVLLHDAYDLPAAAVAAALVTDEDDALRRIAQARLALPAAGAPSDPPELANAGGAPGAPAGGAAATAATDATAAVVRTGSEGAGHADLATLARLADDRPVDADVRRHVLSCGPCRAAVQGQSRAARVVAGVVVVGPDERARAAVVGEVERRARERLPRVAPRRVAAVDEPTGPFARPAPEPEPTVVPSPLAPDAPEGRRRLLSPLLVVLSVVLAVLAGVGAGLLMSQRAEPQRLAGADGRLPPGVRLVSPQPGPPSTLPSPPTVAEQRPRTGVVVVPPPPLPAPTPPSPSPSPTPSPSAAAPVLAVQPPSGPVGTELTLTGTGFPPGAPVRLDYLDGAGAPTGVGADAVAGADGTVTATVVVPDSSGTPGPHDVVATAGETTARATFTVVEP